MKQYLDIVRRVLAEGKVKHNRTGIDTLACPFITFSHNMEDGFPLLTTKKMGIRNVSAELEGFLRGITDKKWYQDRDCHVWDEWANPTTVRNMMKSLTDEQLDGFGGWEDDNVEHIKKLQKVCNDLGPIYGYQWRMFGENYGKQDFYDGDWAYESNGVKWGNDQLKGVLEKLKQNPNDRRMICSAWNPNQMDLMALPACTVLWNVVVIDGSIHLGWFQRSADVMLGIPYDVSSHAIILLLLAKYSGFKPGILHGTFADCHIYLNHVDGAKEQLEREPRPLPQCNIIGEPFDLASSDFVKWTYQDIEILNYNPHPKINFEVAV